MKRSYRIAAAALGFLLLIGCSSRAEIVDSAPDTEKIKIVGQIETAAPAAVPEILRILLEHVDIHFLRRLDEINANAEKLRLCREKARRCREKLRRRKEKLLRRKKKAKALKKKARRLKKELNALRKSSAYRLGRLLTWPARKLKSLLP